MAVVSIGLGVLAIEGIGRSGGVDAANLEHAVAATSLARSADAGLATMETALLRRRLLASTPAARQLEEDRFAGLAKRVAEDLRTVADRAFSEAVRGAAAGADTAATAWIDATRHAHRQPSPDWARLGQLAAIARERSEALADAIAADARRQRDEARAAAVAGMHRILAGTAAALLFGCVVAAWLARRVAGPIAAASRAASSIVSGRLDTPIPEGGDGELGTLLEAMERMRNSLRTRASREKAEERDTRSQLAEALEVSMDGIVLTDAAGRITAVNHRASQMLPDIVLAPGEDWNRAAASLRVPDPTMAAALWHAPLAAAEVKLRGGRWLRVSRSPARGGGAVAILSDITASKAHEAALSESNRRFSAAIGNMAQGLCMVDAEGRILVCNQRFSDMFGLPPAEIMAGVLMRDGSRIAMEAARYPLDLLLQIKDDQRSLKEGSKAFSVVREGADGAALATSYEPMPGGGWVATYADVSERRAAEERQALLMRELDHRAKNALAVVQAALRLTPKDDAEAYAQAVGGRVGALARAHTLLAKGQWSGAELRDLAWGELAPFLGSAAADKRPQPRAGLDGPDVTLVPGAAQAISMALHELATNATKHGALSTPEGRVSVFWEVDGDAGPLRLLWTEAGGPPVTAPPTRRGFGSRLLEATLKDQLGGKLTREWRPGGLVCAIELPVSRALAGQARQRPIRTGLESDFVPTGGGMMASHGTHTGTAATRPAEAVGAAIAPATAATPAVRQPGGAGRHTRAFGG